MWLSTRRISGRESMLVGEEFQEILSQFPEIEFAFSYGSGIIQQAGYDYNQEDPSKLPMYDFIFSVEDPLKWHKENMKRNPLHYTSLLDSQMLINFIQGPESTGVSIWFNVEIPLNLRSKPQRRMKYGIVKTSKLLEDLLDWDYLYLAGRLHKPVTIISSPTNPAAKEVHNRIEAAIERNRIFALNVSLLTLAADFSENDLYLQIAGLSYRGDIRLLFAENPNKVKNIVLPNIPSFRSIYRPLLDHPLSLFSALPIVPLPLADSTTPIPRSSSESHAELSFTEFLHSFPSHFTTLLHHEDAKRLYFHYLSLRNDQRSPSNPLPLQERERIIDRALRKIVGWPAFVQSAKGLLCVGTGKGGSYLLAKILKRFTK